VIGQLAGIDAASRWERWCRGGWADEAEMMRAQTSTGMPGRNGSTLMGVDEDRDIDGTWW
jgi:hypothetical protein